MELTGSEVYAQDNLTLYTLTDYHLGMMAWEDEGGRNWDLNIAEETFYKWLNHQMSTTIPTEEYSPIYETSYTSMDCYL